ncbi:MAG: hypothetical protein CML13_06900 [Puniceicoccaceae bacterium]|nr:hypothetical protein [Puniceicoccaceae bacterium]|tara:strand:+ start:9243 stop:9686 length:444 start_codon:yes stop_codon:yes gene_type:complete
MNDYTKAYIDFNRKLIKEEFPWFDYHEFSEYGAMFTGEIWDSDRSKKAILRIVCDNGFPDSKPNLSIAEPKILHRFEGCPLNLLGLSHDFHCLEANEVGEVRICHTASWDASITLLEPISKAYLWWNAYVLHLQTGKSIDSYFNPED